MSFYIPAAESANFQDNTLVLPALTLGHVGQLALDAIITTLKLPKVGYIDEPNVLPTLSNDAFAADQDSLTTSLEVFHSSEKKVTILQQRAPVVRAYNAQYAASIIQWAKSAHFKEIIILMSADATRRNDEQLVGTQFRFASTQSSFLRERATELKWIELEAETKDSIIKQGTVAQRLLEEGEKQSFPVSVVLLFCAEGNNVPDGLTMASHVNQYLKVKESNPNPNPQVSEWLVPSSWSVLLEGPPIDRSLFM
jgi:proteasome assembly chaperone 2